MKSAQTSEGGNQSILDGICSLIFITKSAQCDVEERVLVKQDEAVEGFEVATLGAGDEVGFVGGEEGESFHTYFIPPACYENVAGVSQFCNR